MQAIAAAVIAYGPCVLTWSIWSEPDARDERIVVSEIGEQWSPKHPPPITAPTATYTTVSNSPPVKLNARGITIGSMIAYVPMMNQLRMRLLRIQGM